MCGVGGGWGDIGLGIYKIKSFMINIKQKYPSHDLLDWFPLLLEPCIFIFIFGQRIKIKQKKCQALGTHCPSKIILIKKRAFWI